MQSPTTVFPPQKQEAQPGIELIMQPQPTYDNPAYRASGKLEGKVALITGGDSGIGRAVALAYAKEGADVAIAYLNECADAKKIESEIIHHRKQCLRLQIDLKEEKNCVHAVQRVMDTFGKVDILINNAGVQYPQNSIMDITDEQLQHTFESNVFSAFYLTRAAVPRMTHGGVIINTSSITAFRGNPTLIDYSATKGALVAFTHSLALSLVEQNIRVNAVAPGPVWTPLIVSSFSPQKVEKFGQDTPMKRAAQPYELAPTYVFLASDDASNISGQVFHVNSGTII